MICVKELVKDFGGRVAVNGVSFELSKGDVLGFLGPNGAGKTTTMRMIVGFLPPTSGTAVVCGHNIVQDPIQARKRIGYMPENAPLYGDMTVQTFLQFVAEIRRFIGKERDEKVDATIKKCFLQDVRHQTIETLSKGYRQRTCFAQTMIHNPPVLILDEPTDGLDPNQKQLVRNMIQEMAADKAIILSTHILEEAEAICTRAIIISNGKVVTDSTPAELKKQAPSYNALTLKIVASAEEAKNTFEQLGDVDSVDVLDSSTDHVSLRLFPKNGQPLATTALEEAHSHNWLVKEMQSESGRLEEVFQHLTVTENVSEKVK
ncbi:MAG: ATP-binding cassette domain-containing protein [Kiritimatiellae bacterium]|nr:ATP-binding cassette domain-containing protein [Kiritimatiellia bacterium]